MFVCATGSSEAKKRGTEIITESGRDNTRGLLEELQAGMEPLGELGDTAPGHTFLSVSRAS